MTCQILTSHSQANERPVSRSRDHSWPMRGQYPALLGLKLRLIWYSQERVVYFAYNFQKIRFWAKNHTFWSLGPVWYLYWQNSKICQQFSAQNTFFIPVIIQNIPSYEALAGNQRPEPNCHIQHLQMFFIQSKVL